jgi:hypothetical protein
MIYNRQTDLVNRRGNTGVTTAPRAAGGGIEMSVPSIDDRVRDLFSWVKAREAAGVDVANRQTEVTQPDSSWPDSLGPNFEISPVNHSLKITFIGSNLVIRNDDGSRWKLV